MFPVPLKENELHYILYPRRKEEMKSKSAHYNKLNHLFPAVQVRREDPSEGVSTTLCEAIQTKLSFQFRPNRLHRIASSPWLASLRHQRLLVVKGSTNNTAATECPIVDGYYYNRPLGGGVTGWSASLMCLSLVSVRVLIQS